MKKQPEELCFSNTGIHLSTKKTKPQPSDEELIDNALAFFNMLLHPEQHNHKPPIYFDGTHEEE